MSEELSREEGDSDGLLDSFEGGRRTFRGQLNKKSAVTVSLLEHCLSSLDISPISPISDEDAGEGLPSGGGDRADDWLDKRQELEQRREAWNAETVQGHYGESIIAGRLRSKTNDSSAMVSVYSCIY